MPATPNPKCYHQSASSISSFKACPQRFRLAYREGLRADRDTDSQRCGTNWHAMHEEYANALARLTPQVSPSVASEGALAAVVSLLNQRYSEVPPWIEGPAWALERQVLLTSFIGYLWYWQNDPVEVLASEVPFNLPLHMPRTGLPLPMTEVQRVGKIDHIIKWQDSVCSLERKSTTRSIAHDSDYWDKSKKDTQVSMYALAFKDMALAGILPKSAKINLAFGLRFGNTLYDVWHKPTIKPAWLTQKDTAEFLLVGVYMGQQFSINRGFPDTDPLAHHVNGVRAEMEQGKKGVSIKETVEMFGARLLQDIYERPDFYYARREIARTEQEIREFRRELFSIYQAQKAFAKHECWFSNEQQCRATFACQYIPICYGPGADAVCDGRTVPAGFKRIFVDLTVNGKEVEE